MSQPRIFVSHSHKDDAFTVRLVADLRARGAEVWVDDAAIPHGNFPKHISDGLDKSEWLVLVLTPNAIDSEWVKDEVFTALDLVKQKRMQAVIPFLALPCPSGTIPALWGALQRYDATSDYPSAFAKLCSALGLVDSPPPPKKMPPVGEAFRPRPTQPPPGVEALHPRPIQLPPNLASLGFVGKTALVAGKPIEYILPPLCSVPAGSFLMGSDPKRDPVAKESWTQDEQPQHTVTLSAYDIARHPVTVAEYACFVRAGQPVPKRDEYSGSIVDWQTQLRRFEHPVVCVTWHDAVAYAAWLSERTGERWRLPTEAQWEKAARGTDGRIYPWGDAFDKGRCNTQEGGKNGTTQVGTYPTGAGPFGAQDMAGNVWEWTGSRYLPYPYITSGEREDVNSTDNRVLRGGSWYDDAGGARAAYRGQDLPVGFSGSDGFRVVRVSPSS